MRLRANGIDLEVEDAGPRDGEPLLLVMGLGMQLVAWPDALLAQLHAHGLRTLRFDNRDIGLSTHLDALGVPSLAWAAVRHALRLRVRAPYTLSDMAADTVGLMDALALPWVHLCGVSMGGMIAQHVAAMHPARVRSLTLVMTTSGDRRLPQPRPAVQRALLSRPAGPDLPAAASHLQHLLRLIGSPGYPAEPAALRARIDQALQRSWHPQGAARQLLAIAADGDRSKRLGHITAPTSVVHGRDDPLVPVAAAHDLVRKIAHARAEIIPGMGHDLPEALMPRLAAAIATNARRPDAPQAPGR